MNLNCWENSALLQLCSTSTNTAVLQGATGALWHLLRDPSLRAHVLELEGGISTGAATAVVATAAAPAAVPPVMMVVAPLGACKEAHF